MNKFNTTLLVLILVVVIVGIGVVLVFNQKKEKTKPTPNESKGSQVLPSNNVDNKPSEPVEINTEPEVIESDIDTSGWQTYKNEELRFEFRYPQEWGIDLKESLSSGDLFTLKEDISEIQNITVRVHHNQQDEIFKIGTQASINVAEVFDNNCTFNIRGNFLLPDGSRIIIFPHQPQLFSITEKDCYELFNNFEENRKLSNRAGHEVVVSVDEIPDRYLNNYKIFKTIVDSFQAI